MRRRGPPASGRRRVLFNDSLRGVGQQPPAEDAVAHTTTHVVVAAVFDDSRSAVGTGTILDSIYPLREERVLEEIP